MAKMNKEKMTGQDIKSDYLKAIILNLVRSRERKRKLNSDYSPFDEFEFESVLEVAVKDADYINTLVEKPEKLNFYIGKISEKIDKKYKEKCLEYFKQIIQKSVQETLQKYN